MRLVGYRRVSSESQLDGFGLDIQDKAMRRWARHNDHRIVLMCTDEAISGAKDATDRPGLSAALSALQRPEHRGKGGMFAPPVAEGLLVARLDRLARALTVQEAALAIAWRAGGRVFTADGGEVLADDPDDPMRTALRQVVGVFAELERRMVVKRLKDGRNAKAATGRHSVGAYPYGYMGAGTGRERDVAPNPQEQLGLARIVELRRAGNSYRAIVATLATEGVPSRSGGGWTPDTVRRIWLRQRDQGT
jgi:DNA invertase Pin-like site-specific DNA recombinase